MRFQQLHKKDLPAALALIEQHYGKRFLKIARRDLAANLSGQWLRPEYVIVKDKKAVIGLGGFSESWMDTSIAELFWVNVSKNRQNSGIGTAIIKKLLAKIKQKKYSLVLLTTTRPGLYKRLGFKRIGALKNGYKLFALYL